VAVHDPMFTDAELASQGWTPYHLGEPLDAAVIQTDHPEYHSLSTEDLPAVATIVDGRRMLEPAMWPGVRVIQIGQGKR
jgi:UDP-N-acetyl-D-mannosaminuronate dehydrogenase